MKQFANVHFAGHSLGGGLAMAMAARTGHHSSYTVFNAAGVHPRTVGGADVLARILHKKGGRVLVNPL